MMKTKTTSNENSIRSNATYAVFILNVFFYYFTNYQLYGSTEKEILSFSHEYTFIPIKHYFLTYFTSMFLHGGIDHLFFNMLFLLIYGRNVEKKIGTSGFLILYFGSGLLATEVSLFYYIGTWMDMFPQIGSSGAIAGVLGAYYYLNRGSYSIRSYLSIIWVINELYKVYQYAHHGLFSTVNSWAHLGGFIWGVVIIFFMNCFKHIHHSLFIISGCIFLLFIMYFILPKDIGPSYDFRMGLMKQCYQLRQSFYKDEKSKKKHSRFGKRLIKYFMDLQKLIKKHKLGQYFSSMSSHSGGFQVDAQTLSKKLFILSDELKYLPVTHAKIHRINSQLSEIMRQFCLSIRSHQPKALDQFHRQMTKWYQNFYSLLDEYGLPYRRLEYRG